MYIYFFENVLATTNSAACCATLNFKVINQSISYRETQNFIISQHGNRKMHRVGHINYQPVEIYCFSAAKYTVIRLYNVLFSSHKFRICRKYINHGLRFRRYLGVVVLHHKNNIIIVL